MADALQAIIYSKLAISLQRGSVDPKFQIKGVARDANLQSLKKGDKAPK